jgi:surface protein
MKTSLFYHLVILLNIILVNLLKNSRNIFILFSEENRIRIKINENDRFPILYSNYYLKPSSYYLNYDVESRIPFTDSEIELLNSENNITIIFTNEITSCESMFKGCSNIIEIDFSNFISSNIQNIDNMFDGCTSLKNINFGNFETSQVINMRYVFKDCSSLESLDLLSFDTSKVTDFHYMFYGCSSLKYLCFFISMYS